MFVCLCKAVRDHTIEEVVRQGARTVSDVEAATQAGTVCGNCLPLVEEVIEDVLITLDDHD